MALAAPEKAAGDPGSPRVDPKLTLKSDAWTDLALTLPIFLIYHLGVVFLPVRNAADPVTHELRSLANASMVTYAGITLAIGAAFVLVLITLGRGKALDKKRFLYIAVEGALYAILMRFAGAYAVGSLRLGPPGGSGVFSGVVMSLGAGFYEEIAFRVGLFGLGALILRRVLAAGPKRLVAVCAWAVCAAMVFSGWHYVGELGDSFELSSFVFRAVCGLVLTAIYALRGFAPAVWTHALYDIWVLVLR
jgi:Type II CAAX prenyl endopeptidase Rce1-like